MISDYPERHMDNSSKLVGLFILYFVCEAFLGGGGDVFSFNIGGIRFTLRIINFILFLLIMIFNLKFDKIGKTIIVLLTYCVFSYLWGIINGHSSSAALNDFRVESYVVVYFAVTKFANSKYSSQKYIMPLLLICATIISAISIGIYFAVNSGVISFYEMNYILNNISDDAMLRINGAFVYPGLMFVIAAEIYLILKMLLKKINLIEKFLCAFYPIAIFLSITRGLILSLLIGVVLVLIVGVKKRKIKISTVIFISISIIILYYTLTEVDISRISDFTDQSSAIRIKFISESFELLNNHPLYYFIGAGYGTALPTKGTSDLEISLLNILLEQGIVGIVLWLSFYINILRTLKLGLNVNVDQDILVYTSIISILAMIIRSQTNTGMAQSGGFMLSYIFILMFYHIKKYENNIAA